MNGLLIICNTMPIGVLEPRPFVLESCTQTLVPPVRFIFMVCRNCGKETLICDKDGWFFVSKKIDQTLAPALSLLICCFISVAYFCGLLSLLKKLCRWRFSNFCGAVARWWLESWIKKFGGPEFKSSWEFIFLLDRLNSTNMKCPYRMQPIGALIAFEIMIWHRTSVIV